MPINPRHQGIYATSVLSAIPVSHTTQYVSIPTDALCQAQAFRQLITNNSDP